MTTLASRPMPEGQDAASPTADGEIHALLRERREEGLVALLRKHGGRVRACLIRKFGAARTDDVDDAVSVAAWKVWDRIDEFDPDRLALGSWFFVVARNALITALRASKTTELVVGLGGENFDSLAQARLVERSDAQGKLLQALAGCIDKLAPTQRSIVVADLEHGASADGEALGKRLNTSANSIYVSRNRAHTNLRKCLATQGYG